MIHSHRSRFPRYRVILGDPEGAISRPPANGSGALYVDSITGEAWVDPPTKGTPAWVPIAIDADNIFGDFEYIDFETGPYTGGHQEGRLHWDDDNGTVSIGMPGGTVELQIGQEHLVRCRNQSGAQIADGSVVYITGNSGNKPLIDLADASVAAQPILGIATETIDHNSNGYVCAAGVVSWGRW